MLEPSGLYYPYRFARFYLQGMQVALGDEGYDAVLGLAGLTTYFSELPPPTMERKFDFAYFAALSEGLEAMYGARGGRSMDLRIGRAWFEAGFASFGAFAGMQHPSFQSLAQSSRARIALAALAAIHVQHTDQHIHLEVLESTYQLQADVSPMAWGRQAERPVCHAFVGLIQACLRLASNGYEYHVHERTCQAAGHDECLFEINQKPIGQL